MDLAPGILLDLLSLESTQGKPPWHTAWAEMSDPSLSVGLLLSGFCAAVGFSIVFVHSAFGACSDPGGKVNTTKPRQWNLADIFGNIYSNSKLDVVTGAIAQVASESAAGKSAKQLKYLKDKLLNIGQELECV
jgi:hypothetical protein